MEPRDSRPDLSAFLIRAESSDAAQESKQQENDSSDSALRTGRRRRRGRKIPPAKLVENKRNKRKRTEKERARRSSRLITVYTRDAKRHPKSYGFDKDQVALIEIPPVFSFLEDPEKALEVLGKIQSMASRRAIRHINIDHRACRELGLCCSVVMDVSLLQARRKRRKDTGLSITGQFSKASDEVNILLKASGIPHQLGLSESMLDAEVEASVRRSELSQGSSNRRERSPQRNAAAEALTGYFNDCLMSLGYELLKAGKKYLGDLLTEVIGNAQEHGGGKWYTIGHWQRGTSGDAKKFGVCRIVIFNYGATIYESLSSDVSISLREQLRSLAEKHRSRGFIQQVVGPKWDEETLYTVFALQERVSRFNGMPGVLDRGNGTVDIIDFFMKLSGKNGAKMCIVSGHTYILFDGEYEMKPVRKGDEELQVIAFNRDNDLEKPPDPSRVHRLNRYFPGTIVSIELTLEEEYLKQIAGSHGASTRN